MFDNRAYIDIVIVELFYFPCLIRAALFSVQLYPFIARHSFCMFLIHSPSVTFRPVCSISSSTCRFSVVNLQKKKKSTTITKKKEDWNAHTHTRNDITWFQFSVFFFSFLFSSSFVLDIVSAVRIITCSFSSSKNCIKFQTIYHVLRKKIN